MARPDDLPESSLVQIFGTTSIPEGLLVKGLLEAEGIPVQIKGESEGPYRMGPVFLWVPAGFEVQARLLLEDISSGAEAESAVAWEPEPTEGRD